MTGWLDPFLEHALVHALYQLATRQDLDQLAGHRSAFVRRAALVLLDQPPHQGPSLELVLRSLASSDVGLRHAALRVLKRHPEWSGREASAPSVLGYLRQAAMQGWRPDTLQLQSLMQQLAVSHPDHVAQLTDELQRSEGEIARKLAEFETLLVGGDAERGRGVFFSQKTSCSACHRIGSEGAATGPDLTRIGTVRSGRDLVEAIVAPSSTFAQGYEAYTVVTQDGQVLTGILAEQDVDRIVLRDASGTQRTLPKDRIDTMHRTTVSLMPDGLQRTMTRGELSHLLAFLLSLK